MDAGGFKSSRHYELALETGKLLKAKNLMLATVESCTGGGIAASLTDVPGSSEWFERGFVTYSNDSKRELVGVKRQTLAEHGAVSEAVAREMSVGALIHSNADVAVSVTGVAGPDGGTADKPVGTVWISWAERQGCSLAKLHNLHGDRAAIRDASIVSALNGLHSFVKSFG